MNARHARKGPGKYNAGMPDRLEESGFGSAEAQLLWRFFRETERLPEWYFLDAGRVTAKLKSED